MVDATNGNVLSSQVDKADSSNKSDEGNEGNEAHETASNLNQITLAINAISLNA